MPRLLRFPPDELTVAPANDRPRLCSYLRIRPRRFLLHQVVSNIPMSGRIPGYFAGYLDADVYGPAITVVSSQAGARHRGRRQWRGHRRRNWKPDYAATVRRTAPATHERTVLTLFFLQDREAGIQACAAHLCLCERVLYRHRVHAAEGPPSALAAHREEAVAPAQGRRALLEHLPGHHDRSVWLPRKHPFRSAALFAC